MCYNIKILLGVAYSTKAYFESLKNMCFDHSLVITLTVMVKHFCFLSSTVAVIQFAEEHKAAVEDQSEITQRLLTSIQSLLAQWTCDAKWTEVGCWTLYR